MILNLDGPIAFTIACVVAVVASPLLIRIGAYMGALDLPGPGRIHLRPVVRLGGLVVFPAFSIALFATAADPGQFVGIAVCAAAITAVGLADDICQLRPWIKLVGQIAVALSAVGLGVQIAGISNPLGGVIELPPLAGGALTVFWLVGMMNAVNLLDGLDGLAPGVVLVAASIMAILSAQLGSGELVLFGLALMGAISGFLPFNAYKARLILGDSGSQLLGFLIGTLAVLGQAKIGTTLLVLGIPILDVAWTITRRRLSGRGIMARDTEHLHHRLLDVGLTRTQVAVVYVCLCSGFGAAALFLDRIEKIVGLTLLVIVTGALLFIGSRGQNRSR